MAKRPDITTVSQGYYGRVALNQNFENLQEGFDNTLSLDGSTPNAMNANLDMNSNDILNANVINTKDILVNGQTLEEVLAGIGTSPGNLYAAIDTFTGDGSTTAFTLSLNPLGVKGVVPYIDGVKQYATTAYTVSGSTLTFSEAPAYGAAIEVLITSLKEVSSLNVSYPYEKTYATVAALLAATDTFSAGAYISVLDGDYTYKAAASGDVTNAGGQQFSITDLFDLDVRMWGPANDGVTDDSAKLQAALDLWRSRLAAGSPCRLKIRGDYLSDAALTLPFSAASFAQGVLDCAGGKIEAGASVTSGSLLRVSSSATVRNISFEDLHLEDGSGTPDVLLELDGGDADDTPKEFLYRFAINNPVLEGSKVPLWIRNNAFEAVIYNPRISPSGKSVGYYGILLDDDFDASTPDGSDGGTVTSGNVSSIAVYGGTITKGYYNVYERSPADIRFFGTTMLESAAESYRGPATTQNGGLFGCHFENAWDTDAWVAATAYVVGDVVENDTGKIYKCTTAGTSAGSGGPTGTGSSISDGTCVWDYQAVRGVIRMDNQVLAHNCDYRQNTGYATTLLESFLAGEHQTLSPHFFATSGVDYLYVRNNSDNGARANVPSSFREKISYASASAGPLLVSVAANTNLQVAGTNTFTPDLTLGPVWKRTAGNVINIGAPLNGREGDKLTVVIVQDGTGGRNVNFNAVFNVSGVTLDTTASTHTTWEFVYDGTNWLLTSFVTGIS